MVASVSGHRFTILLSERHRRPFVGDGRVYSRLLDHPTSMNGDDQGQLARTPHVEGVNRQRPEYSKRGRRLRCFELVA